MSWFCRTFPWLCRPTPAPPVPVPPNPPAAPPTPTPDPSYLALLNAERTLRNLAPLRADPALERLAADWAAEMARRVGLTHGDFGGRIDKVYPNRAAAENVAVGVETAAEVVKLWMNSAGHRANILGAYTHVGVGSARAGGPRYWCADLARL